MPYFDIIWDDEPGGNADKIAQHGLTKDDVADVFDSPKKKLRSRSSGRPLWEGCTQDGRTVVVIFEWVDKATVIPVTAYEPNTRD